MRSGMVHPVFHHSCVMTLAWTWARLRDGDVIDNVGNTIRLACHCHGPILCILGVDRSG